MTKFGDFQDICTKTPFPYCSVISSGNIHDDYFTSGIVPTCFARSIELSNTMIYQVGNAIINIGGLIVCLIIIFNIRSKYTAIARSEMCVFFYQFTGLLVATLVCDCGIAPPGKSVFGYLVAVQIGLAASCCWCLVFIGLLCFQLWEDGTRRSLVALNLSSFAVWAANFVVALLTFKGWAGDSLSRSHTTGLFAIMFIVNAFFVGTYVLSQLILSVCVLNNYWAFGSILLGCFFFVAGQIVAYVFSELICNSLNHYLDGLFFASLLNLFAIMMVYKYWDIITSEDLEFSVAAQETGVALKGSNAFSTDNPGSKYFPRTDFEEKSLMG